ncbi:hypothetical protein B0H16DRAFT_1459491 [Mycena metata]|uniref:Uncharacterized protein n=1 Tax=Mycena metata TaxID=1033252 RepID=A0AAD7J091_9AGAR|nr:hypothetical protein B0H16DRAFT_1459491 [Mycena metata]
MRRRKILDGKLKKLRQRRTILRSNWEALNATKEIVPDEEGIQVIHSEVSVDSSSRVHGQESHSWWGDIPTYGASPNRTRHGLQDKELMDRWLLAQQQDQFRDDVFLRGLLNMSDVGAGQVPAQLHCVTFPAEQRGEGAEEHLLFLKASAPPYSGLEGAAAESPVVIMDYYGKSNTHRDAPLWTQMSCTMSFRMRRGAAAKLFSTLALAPDNLLEPGPFKEIIDWAGLAAAGTQYANKVQAPETPLWQILNHNFLILNDLELNEGLGIESVTELLQLA